MVKAKFGEAVFAEANVEAKSLKLSLQNENVLNLHVLNRNLLKLSVQKLNLQN